ncbi:platelet endothelial cell adhesion molecule isoform X2 [Narcine bancroftii]|uniref:platelet endothelial cell adhesion molecule isoform X2 n=1 Tax=Narcine bancroftii TaxID=1343680 RepID=UPI0038322CB5
MLKAGILVLSELLCAVVTADFSKGVTINLVEIKSDPEGSAKMGISINLTCSANIVAPRALAHQISYSFYKGSAKMFLLENVVSTQLHSTFTIKSARASHTGFYACTVEVGGEMMTSDPLHVEVKGHLQKPQLAVHPTKLIVGSQIGLLCQADEEIPPLIFVFQKYKNGQFIKVYEIKKNSQNYTNLKIKIKDATDQAYRCSIQGEDLQNISDFSEVVNVTVQDPFSSHQFTIEPQSGFFVGDELTIKCTVQMSHLNSSDTKLELTIVKDTIPLMTNVNGSLEAKISKTANTNDSGEYLCNAKWQSSFKTVKQQVDVTVPVSTPILSSTSIHRFVVQGDGYNLTCSVSGGSWPITYTFYKEATGRPLHQMNLSGFEAVYSIPSAQTSQSGKYFCKATNSAGKSTRTKRSLDINITVKVPVSTPQLSALLNTTIVNFGDNVTLQCITSTGTLPITYSLYRNHSHLATILTAQSTVFQVTINSSEHYGYSCTAENHISSQSSHSYQHWLVYSPILLGIMLILCCIVKHQKSKRLKAQNQHIQDSYRENDYVIDLELDKTGSASGSSCEAQYINVKRQMKEPKMENSGSNENNVKYTEINFACRKVQQQNPTIYARIDMTKL